jgi:hypothetical protein
MQNSVDSSFPAAEIGSRQLIAAELRALIARIEGSIRMIECEMRSEAVCEATSSDDVFVLDDVTPRYATVTAALSGCMARLGLALLKLSDVDDEGAA